MRWARGAGIVLLCAGLAGCATGGARQRPDAVPPLEPVEATLVLADGRFAPAVLEIVPGTTVRFENKDGVFHNAFSISPITPFDLGSLPPGHARTMRFDHPGTIKVYCELHPREMATIIVGAKH